MHTNILNIPWKTISFFWVKIKSFINDFGLQDLYSKYHVELKFYIQGCLISLYQTVMPKLYRESAILFEMRPKFAMVRATGNNRS